METEKGKVMIASFNREGVLHSTASSCSLKWTFASVVEEDCFSPKERIGGDLAGYLT